MPNDQASSSSPLTDLQGHAPIEGTCTVCGTHSDDLAVHIAPHLTEGRVTVIVAAGHAWYVDVASGTSILHVPTSRPPTSTTATRISTVALPTRRFAAIGILIGLIPALISGIVFFNLVIEEPFLEWAAGPSAFIIVLRGVRRMVSRVLIKRFVAAQTQPVFTGRPTPVADVAHGVWVRHNDGTAVRVIGSLGKDVNRTLVLIDGTTIDATVTGTVDAGVVATSGF